MENQYNLRSRSLGLIGLIAGTIILSLAGCVPYVGSYNLRKGRDNLALQEQLRRNVEEQCRDKYEKQIGISVFQLE